VINIVVVGGNLTRDPELRYTPKGTAVCSLSVAVNRTWKGEGGEKKEEVTFVECTCFGRSAETITQYFKKGKRILVEGRLKQDQWDDKQTGQKRTKLYVVVEKFSFVDSNQNQNQSAPVALAAPAPASEPSAAPSEEDDVPF
jgi:single-strand DNA-binding protein